MANDDAWSLESESDSPSWIEEFCDVRGHEFFCHVEKSWVEDRFNLHGLNKLPHFDDARSVILDRGYNASSDKEEALIEKAANHLYGLIHARFIITEQGMSHMLAKFKNGEFGKCPRVFCNGQSMLPIGQHDAPNTSYLKLYCPCCEELYYPPLARHGKLDGAYFGTTFPHLFLQTYPKYYPQQDGQREHFVPRVFGYKLHSSSKEETIRKEEEKEEQAREWSRQQKAARSVGGPLSGFGRGAPRTQTRDSAPTSPTPKTAKSQQPHPEPLTSAMPSQEPKDGLVLCISSESS